MVLALYGRVARFISRAVLLTASVVAMLIFITDIITLFSDTVADSPPIAFVVTPLLGFIFYYASTFFSPSQKNNTSDKTQDSAHS